MFNYTKSTTQLSNNDSTLSLRKNKSAENSLQRREVRPGTVRHFRSDERGLSTVEYVILLVLVAVGTIGAWTVFRDIIIAKLAEQGTAISEAE